MACGKIMTKIRVYTTKAVFVKRDAIVLNNNGIGGRYYFMAGSKIKCMRLHGCPGVLMHFLWMEKTA
jgi:hypothetical protein